MDESRIIAILKSSNAAEQIQNEMRLATKYEFLENLRRMAIEDRRRQVAKGSGSLEEVKTLDERSLAMMGQFTRLDKAVVTALEKETRRNVYDAWNRPDDPDLPEDPTDFAKPGYGLRYAIKRMYRQDFEVTVNERKDGCWPFVQCDLLEPVDGVRKLYIDILPEAVSSHAGTAFIDNYTSAMARQSRETIKTTREEAEKKLAELQAQKNRAEAIKRLVELVGALQALEWLLDKAVKAMEHFERVFKESEARRDVERAWRELDQGSREIEHSSDHVDAFERNRGGIERMC